jgi:hypothetical protein
VSRIAILAAAVVVATAPRLSAHRLDEYLQATRVSIAADAIALEIDLTPGASVAAGVCATIDTNGDGEISEAEGQSYAGRVLDAISVAIDDRPAGLTMQGARFPTCDEMRAGVGTIRLSARAAVASAAGVHRLAYVNEFRPDIGVYLANTLTPSDASLEIDAQRRDWLQRSLSVDYRVADPARRRAGWSLAALAMIGLIAIRAAGAARPSRPS